MKPIECENQELILINNSDANLSYWGQDLLTHGWGIPTHGLI